MDAPRFGDLAQSVLLRRHAAQLKADLAARSQEVATGRADDISARLGGDTARLATIERDLALMEPLRQLQAEATTRSAAMQGALGRVQSQIEPLSMTLIDAANSTQPTPIATAGAAARRAFDDAASALNAAAGGRALFAGARVSGPALAAPDAMLAALRGAIGAETDAGAIAGIVRDWFGPGGGFEETGYLGATRPVAEIPLGQGETATLDLRADDPALRRPLAATALAALATDPALNLPQATSRALFGMAGADLLAARDPLTGLRAALGAEEARIEQAGARLQSARTGAELARSALIGVDPYEAATRVEALGQQLESLYAVTSRLSRLTLLEQLR